MTTTDAGIGMRVKSGWATAVLVSGSVQAPKVIDRRTVELCDPSDSATRQPYHAAMGKLETDEEVTARRGKVIRGVACKSMSELIADYRSDGYRLQVVAIVVGSDIDPARIANPHIRAHALEGRLFRSVVEEGGAAAGLTCSVIVERVAYKRASEALNRSEEELKRIVAGLKGTLPGSWRADDKLAALAGWVALAAVP